MLDISDQELIDNLKESFNSGCSFLEIHSRRQSVGIKKCQRGVDLGFLRFVEIPIDEQETHWRFYFTDKAKNMWSSAT